MIDLRVNHDHVHVHEPLFCRTYLVDVGGWSHRLDSNCFVSTQNLKSVCHRGTIYLWYILISGMLDASCRFSTLYITEYYSYVSDPNAFRTKCIFRFRMHLGALKCIWVRNALGHNILIYGFFLAFLGHSNHGNPQTIYCLVDGLK